MNPGFRTEPHISRYGVVLIGGAQRICSLTRAPLFASQLFQAFGIMTVLFAKFLNEGTQFSEIQINLNAQKMMARIFSDIRTI